MGEPQLSTYCIVDRYTQLTLTVINACISTQTLLSSKIRKFGRMFFITRVGNKRQGTVKHPCPGSRKLIDRNISYLNFHKSNTNLYFLERLINPDAFIKA